MGEVGKVSVDGGVQKLLPSKPHICFLLCVSILHAERGAEREGHASESLSCHWHEMQTHWRGHKWIPALVSRLAAGAGDTGTMPVSGQGATRAAVGTWSSASRLGGASSGHGLGETSCDRAMGWSEL